MKKRIASILLAVMMIVTLLPLGLVDTAWAATVVGSGDCSGYNSNVTWKLTSDGTLTISGTGYMKTYYVYNDEYAPWYNLRSQVKKVIITNGVTNTGGYTFYECSNLESVTIADSVTAIGRYTFYECSSLKSVTIPDSVTSIGEWAFYACTGLTSVNIPNSVTRIDMCAFYECSSLKSVTIPSSVTQIGAAVFASSGVSVTVVPDNKRYCSENGMLFDKEKTELCYGGPSGTAFRMPESVETIGWLSFYGRNDLTSITIPGNVKEIGNTAFKNCENLRSVVLSDGVTKIGGSVFYYCTVLTSITIPKSLTSIGADAFLGCDSLTDVYYGGTAADWDNITIWDNSAPLKNATLHCAKSAPAAPVVKIGNSATSGKPVLTWNAVYGATSYRIYRSTSKGSGYSLLGTVTATSYTNTGAKAGTTYYYRVKACNDAGLSPYSNVVSGKVKSVTPKPAAPVVKIGHSASSGKVKSVTPKPAAPVVKIGHSASSGKPMLTWNAVSGATSYKVYRATSQNGTYSLLGTVTATSYINTGAKDGVTYYYKVKAVNSAGESAYSNTVSGQSKAVTPKPAAPVVKIGHSATSGKPMLTWNAVDGAASYKVYRATAKNGAYSVINTTKALTYTNTGAALGTTYYYKVEALDASGKSMGFSDVVEGKVAPVLAVGYSSVSGKPMLTWNAVPGATEYQVYRSTQQNSGYTKINSTTATSYVNTGAKANTTYYYKIVAVKGTAVSDFSNIVSARPGK